MSFKMKKVFFLSQCHLILMTVSSQMMNWSIFYLNFICP